MPIVRFGPFQLDTRSLELTKEGSRVRLRPQPCRLLAALVVRPAELMTRDELRAVLWPDDIHVRFDAGLNSCLKQIRRALADPADNPMYIETLARRGYRFIAATETVPGPAGPPQPKLVILPFEAVDPAAPATGAIAAGLLEEIAVAHARRRSAPFALYVGTAVTDLFTQHPSFRAIRASGVKYLLEGVVRSGTNRLRVTCKVLATSDFTQIWAGGYDAPVGDLIAAQQRIAEALVADLCDVLGDDEDDQHLALRHAAHANPSFQETLT